LNIRHGNGASTVVRARESLVHGEGKQLIILVQIKGKRERRMRNPEKVLNTLCLHSKVSDYKYERLYRILFNEEMFFVAYQRIYDKQGNMTPGTDGQTIDQMSIQRIECLIESLRNETYQPHPARRVYIPKKNGKSRPLGIPSFEDKLVQEVTRMVLEAIYEGHFESTSHGFRPYKSCHTALTHIQRQFTGTRWFIEGDIKGFFDNIDHNILISILQERISDERFLRLIRKFLNAGYIENWKYNRTYSGTPQGGIISPILANIYLDKFDKYIREYTEKFNVGVKRQRNAAYFRVNTRAVNHRKLLKSETDPCVKAELAEKVRNLQLELRSIPCSHEMDENYRRMKYVRYADDFLIGVIGSKADCEKIKVEIAQYMNDALKLELSAEKTLITHAQKTAKFLGYEISVRKSSAMKRNRKGVLQRDFNGRAMLLLPMETVKKKLKEYDAISLEQANGCEVWKPQSRSYLTAKKPQDILAQYNWEIRGFYNYYRIANNVSATCSKFGYIMEYSMYMTLAQKLRSSISKIMKRFYKDKQFIIPYTDDKGRRQYRIFYDGGFKRQNGIADIGCDTQPFTVLLPYPTLVERLKANYCEMCGAEGTTVMHQVRTLKALSKENEWSRIMLKRNRKTLAVCETCNAKIREHGK
jgi:group II intron reverse transcriptase/maturase